MTPTTALADVVLPAATVLEFNDIGHYGLGHGYILSRPRVVEPPPQCWPDIKILNELGKALGLGKYWFDDYEEIPEEILRPSGLTYAQFAERGMLKSERRYRKYLEKGFATPTGKVELALSKAEEMGFPLLPEFECLPEELTDEFPLVLTSAKPAEFLCSSNRRIEALRKRRPDPLLTVHPDTARESGIVEGDEVYVITRRGQITFRIHLWDGVDPRVVCADPCWWLPETGPENLFSWDRSNFNVLTDGAKLGKAFGTPNLRAIACRISKV